MFTKVCIDAYNIAQMNDHTRQGDLVRSADDVRHEFEVRGLSIAAWARMHGYSSQLVYRVLAGRKPCVRGQSHQIAVHLRLKHGLIGSLLDIETPLQRAASATAAEASQQENVPMS